MIDQQRTMSTDAHIHGLAIVVVVGVHSKVVEQDHAVGSRHHHDVGFVAETLRSAAHQVSIIEDKQHSPA